MPSTEKARTDKEHRKLTPFGSYIRAAREKCGYSLAEAGKLLRCTKGYVHRLETIQAMNPTIDTLANMAKVYGVDLCEVAKRAAESAPDAAYRETLAPHGKRRI
jgi:transcriptional regulator with XRE-family HTH domain